jgi:hypothetical protein
MDAEDAYRQLRQTRLRCLRLEADKDVEILRAGKYRKILVAGEDGATQAQAAGIFHMLRRTLVCPTLLSVVAQLNLEEGCPSTNITSDRGSSRLNHSPVRFGTSTSGRQKPASK